MIAIISQIEETQQKSFKRIREHSSSKSGS